VRFDSLPSIVINNNSGSDKNKMKKTTATGQATCERINEQIYVKNPSSNASFSSSKSSTPRVKPAPTSGTSIPTSTQVLEGIGRLDLKLPAKSHSPINRSGVEIVIDRIVEDYQDSSDSDENVQTIFRFKHLKSDTFEDEERVIDDSCNDVLINIEQCSISDSQIKDEINLAKQSPDLSRDSAEFVGEESDFDDGSHCNGNKIMLTVIV